MSFGSIIMYIVAMILIAVTLFNLYATATSKKRRNFSKAKYGEIMGPVENALLKEMKKRKLNFDKVKRLMTYDDEALILGHDTEKKVFAIAMAGQIVIEQDSILNDVKKVYETSGKKVLSSKVILDIGEDIYTYDIATKPFNPKGIIGKVVYDTTEDFYNFMDGIKQAKV